MSLLQHMLCMSQLKHQPFNKFSYSNKTFVQNPEIYIVYLLTIYATMINKLIAANNIPP